MQTAAISGPLVGPDHVRDVHVPPNPVSTSAMTGIPHASCICAAAWRVLGHRQQTGVGKASGGRNLEARCPHGIKPFPLASRAPSALCAPATRTSRPLSIMERRDPVTLVEADEVAMLSCILSFTSRVRVTLMGRSTVGLAFCHSRYHCGLLPTVRSRRLGASRRARSAPLG